MAQILECPVPEDASQKRAMLLKHHVAVWDVIASCEIEGSSDATIRNVQPNDLTPILSIADIRAIYTNGAKAYELYQKYIYPQNQRKAYKLPSTSPANAGYSLKRLAEEWSVIKQWLNCCAK
jgi:hypoxanthine-DNA glycosylase